jgi:hypothetical protein
VAHREMMNPLIFEPMDRPHHVGGIHGMNKMRDDPVGLLPAVDLPRFILLIRKERAIRCGDTLGGHPKPANDGHLKTGQR